MAISTLAGGWFFWPSVAIEPLAPLDPSNPLTVPFQITNAGALTLHDVQATCHGREVVVGGAVLDHNSFPATQRPTPSPDPLHPIGDLRPDNSETIWCAVLSSSTSMGPLAVSGPLKSADIEVILEFRAFGFWPHSAVRRFATVAGPDKLLRWVRRPNSS